MSYGRRALTMGFMGDCHAARVGQPMLRRRWLSIAVVNDGLAFDQGAEVVSSWLVGSAGMEISAKFGNKLGRSMIALRPKFGCRLRGWKL